MIRSMPVIFASIVAAAATLSADAQTPVGTSYTYQGQLTRLGGPVNNSADFRVTLWDAESAGTQVGDVEGLRFDDVLVVDGIFTLTLDMGATAFTTDARWLEVSVRVPHDPSDSRPFVTLDPRQRITASPFALQTRGIFVNDAGDRVGIGTTEPNAALTVGDGVNVADVTIANGGLCIDSDGGCTSAGPGSLRVGPGGIHGTDSSGSEVRLAPVGGEVVIGPGGLRFGGRSQTQTRAFDARSATFFGVDLDPISPGGRRAVNFAVPGALPGDIVIYSTEGGPVFPLFHFGAHIREPGIAEIFFQNASGNAVDAPPFTIRLMAIRP